MRFVLPALLAGVLSAQQDMAYITGLVTDQTGAVVPDAQVLVIETATGVRTVARNIQLSVQDRRRVDLVLELDQVTESVTTAAESPRAASTPTASPRVMQFALRLEY